MKTDQVTQGSHPIFILRNTEDVSFMRRYSLPLALLLLVAACGGGSTATTSATVDTTTTTADETTTTEDADFPVTIEAANGAIEIAEKPTAIISLSPTGTEMLFAIGAGEQVIAVDEFSNYPDEAPTTDLSGYEPNIEAIAALNPDLVVVSDDFNDVVAALTAIQVSVIHHPAARWESRAAVWASRVKRSRMSFW
jgi:iron complex transport system substrate-binding protein